MVDNGSDGTSLWLLAQHESSWYAQSPQLEEQYAEASQGAAATQQHAKKLTNHLTDNQSSGYVMMQPYKTYFCSENWNKVSILH